MKKADSDRQELSLSSRKAHTRRIVSLLEKHYGVPERRPHGDPLDSLIHAILSQNTSDVNSGRAYQRLRQAFPTWEAVLKARSGSIERAIRCAGLAPTKAPRIKAALSAVKEQHGTLSLSRLCHMTFDEALDQLGPLPGVGVKTVAVVMLFACGADLCPVDTHVHRLVRRIGLVGENASRDQTFRELRRLVPRGKGLSIHINLIQHGRRACVAGRPRCGDCALRRQCATGMRNDIENNGLRQCSPH